MNPHPTPQFPTHPVYYPSHSRANYHITMSTTVELNLEIDFTANCKSYGIFDDQDQAICKAEHTKRKLAFDDASVILHQEDGYHTIKFPGKILFMAQWLKGNGLYVLQRDLHRSESPHLTGNQQG